MGKNILVIVIFFVFQVVLLALSAWMTAKSKQAKNTDLHEILNTRTVDQLVDDWTAVPFTDIRVQTTECRASQGDVFSRMWAGTVKGCVAVYRDDPMKTEIVTEEVYEQFRYKCDSKSTPGQPRCRGIYSECRAINPIAPVEQTKFLGQYICGIYGGSAFKDVDRVDPTSLSCPAGTQACSDQTSPENTVCYSDLSDCPITDLKFIKKATETAPAGYTTKTFNSDYDIAFTKNYDGLPLTTTAVEFATPCADPSETSAPMQESNQMFEADDTGSCELDINSQKTFDDRFRFTGLETNEWEVQQANGVINKMSNLPGFQNELNGGLKAHKTNHVYNFHVRPTVPWSLACDAGDRSRENVYADFQQGLSYDVTVSEDQEASGASTAHKWIALTLTFPAVLFMVFIPITVMCYGKSCCKVFAFILCLLMFVLGIVFSVLAMKALSQSNVESADLENKFDIYSQVNGCSDDYTVIGGGLFSGIDEFKANLGRMKTFSIVVMVFCIFNPLLTVFLLICGAEK